MTKKKEIKTVGYPVYKCRICEKSFYGELQDTFDFWLKVSQQNLTSYGQEVMKRILPQGGPPLTKTVDLYEVHNCDDGSKGLADLKGIVKIREAIEDSVGNFVDPVTKVRLST